MRKSHLDLYLLLPIKGFIEKQTSVGLLLIFSAVLAVIFANSPWAETYHNFWKQYIHLGINDMVIRKNLLHWINDGLMSMFFFLVGLELKREITQGELAGFRKSVLPVAAAIGGMMTPALIYYYFNGGLESISGWGIPMATDIAFALGILYLLGDRVPLSLKVFLTAIAIVDDLGAVIVIALFYTADLSFFSLAIAAMFFLILIVANQIGIRHTAFYAIMGIGGLWLAILLSGVHATIAAVLAAFAIPVTKKIDPPLFLRKVRLLSYNIKALMKEEDIKEEHREESITNTIEKFTSLTKDATPPLQRLEHALQPFVSFVVLPLFAFANAGVTIDASSLGFFFSPVTLGIILGLIIGKFFGVVFFTKLMVWLKISSLPKGVKWKHIYGVGFLAAIGFTMSLFITELAFVNEEFLVQAKIGILSASLLAGIIGYIYLKWISSKEIQRKKRRHSERSVLSEKPL
ncbi:Na+/H+ antiporter NhaA [Salinimicrobium sp. TH3]|uniref:Na+/H+ antiporter NhaA n=1 Tax=Salinimicrobium sp. TH3 TaxID=2997342 RepID=UPI0022768F8C|nr:Na+/H+ antiporter NhaA [Salinimicrobium sp. TH3]MCY2687149.1 Na+/H+ antiporter NhaA [Salinimicrobium sp. TH3]